MSTLADDIQSYAENITLPWGDKGTVISLSNIQTLADTHSLSGYQVESQALKQEVVPLRYLRNMQTISLTDQIRLLESSVAQIGLGGLGGTILELFLRTGIGTIHCADDDLFEEANLNRQALSTPSNLGQPKTHVAMDRADKINPSVTLTAQHAFLTPATLPSFMAGYDVAVDALGGLESRLHMQHAAADVGIPLVTGALAGWTGYVSVVIPGQTGPADIMGQDNGTEETLGCPAPAVTFMASLMVTETIKLITDQHSPLTGKILVIDLHSLTFETVSIT